MIKVYTAEGCGRCNVLKTKLKAANIEYTEDTEVEFLIEKGFENLPVIEIEGMLFKYSEIIDALKRSFS